ncbi:hypothetical protein EXN66_Car002513 [Channa argus]|uniref:Uncharacterized protein n=1 Tax=Channa argus TaxID=215402 RepID=A0A6G1P973_CHAAH|nr:hypothetical protein EXN66_Car002513 [Channa argus]
MTREMVPCMHMDDRRKIRENYVCAYSLARLLTADLAPIILPNLTEVVMEDVGLNHPYHSKGLQSRLTLQKCKDKGG